MILGLASSQVMLSKSQRKISDKNKKNWLKTRVESIINEGVDSKLLYGCKIKLTAKLTDYDFVERLKTPGTCSDNSKTTKQDLCSLFCYLDSWKAFC